MTRLSIGKIKEPENPGKIARVETAPVQSLFRLVGRDEDALTYSLGFLLAYDPKFCAKLLRFFGLSLPRGFGSDYSVHLQEVTGRGYGRRDIVVTAPGIRLVVEAKIGGSLPTEEQLLLYAREKAAWEPYARRYIVALTQVAFPATTAREVGPKLAAKGINFRPVQWHDVLEVAIGHRLANSSAVSRYLFDQFARYIRRDYQMGYYDAEVSIQDVNLENEAIYEECWVYVTSLKDKAAPLYFAPYFTRKSGRSGISLVSRVLDIQTGKPAQIAIDESAAPTEEHSRRWAEGLERVIGRSKREGWSNGENRLFCLDRPLPLGKTLIKAKGGSKGIPTQIPKGFSLRFDELLGAAG